MHVTASTLHCFCNLLHRANCLYKPVMLYIYRYCFGHYWKCIVHFLDSLAWPAEFPFFVLFRHCWKPQKRQEDATPHFLPGVHQGDSDSQFSVPKRNITVRKTFVELHEEEDELSNQKLSKQLKRSISTGEIMACFVERKIWHLASV